MKNFKEDIKKIQAEIDEYTGEDWNSGRAKIYISARLFQIKQLEDELAFERKVNSRVTDIFKGWFHHAG